MVNHTKNLSPNTELFSSLPPSVAVLIIDVIHAVASLLRWRQSSETLLAKILSRLAESKSFELKHEEFAFALWPHLDVTRRQEKFSRWLSSLKEDQKLSLRPEMWLVCIENRRVKRNEAGEFKGLPTLYKRGKFWDLFACVQFVAKQCDLLSFPVENRRAQVRQIVAEWLKEAGAVKIERQKKNEDTKPAKPSLPCNCACASCARCAAKAPAPAPDVEPVLSVQIQNAKDKCIEIERDMVSLGTSLLNFGNKMSVVDNKLNAICTSARVQLKTAVARQQGRGAEYAPNTEARAHGRAGLELAIEGLRDAQRAAEQMGKHQHAAKLADFARVLGEWRVFQNREVAE